MKRILRCLYVALCLPTGLLAQTLPPVVTSWILNPGGQTGYGGLVTNVTRVAYSATQVYVQCNSVPSYPIGPWQANPNTPIAMNFTFKLPRTPQANMGTPVATGLGHTGVFSNGVSLFNAQDARRYRNQNIWHQDAYVFERLSFDSCLGHPAPGGEYHHHIAPNCLVNLSDSSRHSPLVGFAFDGFPIYGPFGYANANGTGGIVRMRPGYKLRAITQRSSLPNGTALQANQYGPAIGAAYPLGAYVEDYAYDAAAGTLDDHNGRFAVTPEYPLGTYAYFMTVAWDGTPLYPYVVGPTYYGTVPPGNTGPQGGRNVISEPVTEYRPATQLAAAMPRLRCTPNPTNGQIALGWEGMTRLTGKLTDALGRQVASLQLEPGLSYPIDLSLLPPGLYRLELADGAGVYRQTVVRQ